MNKSRNDLILISSLTILALLSLILYFCLQKKENLMVYTYYENQLADVTPLYATRELHLNDVTIVIDNYSVSVTYSACKDQICVQQGRISRPGQTITCLPQKVFVRIEGSEVDIGI